MSPKLKTPTDEAAIAAKALEVKYANFKSYTWKEDKIGKVLQVQNNQRKPNLIIFSIFVD